MRGIACVFFPNQKDKRKGMKNGFASVGFSALTKATDYSMHE